MKVWNGIWKKILVWNGIWKKILVWNGRFLVWNGNGMEENCQHGIWKNRLPFHSIPCPGSRGFYVRAYADDLAVLILGANELWIRGMAQKAINIAANWASEQELQFSSKKTEIVQFTDKRNPNLGSLSMNGSKLELSKEARLLGVTLDSKLTWKPHIIPITRKATTALMQCRQIVGKTWGIKPSMLKWIYTAMIVQSCRMHVCPGLAVSTKSIK